MITIVLLLAAVAAIAVLVAVSACKAYNESQREVRRLHGDLANTQIQLRDTLELWHNAEHKLKERMKETKAKKNKAS